MLPGDRTALSLGTRRPLHGKTSPWCPRARGLHTPADPPVPGRPEEERATGDSSAGPRLPTNAHQSRRDGHLLESSAEDADHTPAAAGGQLPCGGVFAPTAPVRAASRAPHAAGEPLHTPCVLLYTLWGPTPNGEDLITGIHVRATSVRDKEKQCPQATGGQLRGKHPGHSVIEIVNNETLCCHFALRYLATK